MLCAPGSFKGTLPAGAAAAAMARGAAGAVPGLECDRCPVADGGEGSLDVLAEALRGRRVRLEVTGPLGDPVAASYLLCDGPSAVVELAQASGMTLVPADRRDPARTTTFGTGELVADAARRGCREVVVCLGGSATVDGGTGLAQALGVTFLDGRGRPIALPLCGGRLDEIECFEPGGPLPRLRAACDVNNPLCGPHGAAEVYGPQKGASPDQVRRLAASLRRLAALAPWAAELPGSGAAGGAGFGLAAFCGATLERGSDLVLEAVGFARRLRGADLVLTGEGCLDGQTVAGKAVAAVARAAAARGVPCVAIVGRVGPGAGPLLGQGGGLDGVVSLEERFGLDRALREPAPLLAEAAAEVVRARSTRPA